MVTDIKPGEGTPTPGEQEAEAQRMGWVPEEDFKGDKDRWISADKFLERGKNEMPILRERLKKMDGTVARLNTTISSMRKTFGEFQKYASENEDRAYQRALDSLVKKQRVAVEESDTETFDALEVEKRDLIKDIPKQPVVEIEDDGTEEFNAWVDDGNKWFLENPEMGQYAVSMLKFVGDKTGLQGTALYDEIKKEVKIRYPDKFENKNRQAPPTVQGSGEAPPKAGKQTFANLPDEAKRQCKEFMKTIPDFTEKEYLKSYEWE